MLSILIPSLSGVDCLESLYAFTVDPDFEVICGTFAGSAALRRFPFRRIETSGRSYVHASNLLAAAARGQELVFVQPDFIAKSPLWKNRCFAVDADAFRRAGGFNEHFQAGAHEADLCRRLGLPDPSVPSAANHIDRLLLADLWQP
jgi:hypothetical protein